MIKQFKYLAALATTLGTCFAATTAYINGPDEDYGSATTIRNDAVLIGSVAGGFLTMTAPTGQVNSTTTIWNLEIVDGSGGTALANTSATAATTYPNTLTDLWITGNATNFSVCADAANHALPTPVANVGGASSVPVNVHFLLSNAPSSVPAAWFTQALPDYTRIIIEPGSADPGIDTILTDINTAGYTHTALLIGAPVTLLAATTTIDSAVQRHPKVFASYAYNNGTPSHTKAQLTVNANTIFNSTVHGISLALGVTPSSGATVTLDFTKTSSIVDLNAAANANTATFGVFTVEAGKTLTVVGINQAIPTVQYSLVTTASLTSVTTLTNVVGTVSGTSGAFTAVAPTGTTIPALPILATTIPVISWVH